MFGKNELVEYLMKMGAQFEASGSAVIARSCRSCGITYVPLLRCGKCGVFSNCSRVCQENDWRDGGENRHQNQCADFVALKNRYMAKATRDIEDKMAGL